MKIETPTEENSIYLNRVQKLSLVEKQSAIPIREEFLQKQNDLLQEQLSDAHKLNNELIRLLRQYSKENA